MKHVFFFLDQSDPTEVVLLYNNSPVMRAIEVETETGDTVHGHLILEGNGKYLIKDILNEWDGYDDDQHTPDAYIQWPKIHSIPSNNGQTTHAAKLVHMVDGEGVMSGTAQTYQELGLKRGKKRKSDETTWKVTKKRIECNSGQGKEMKKVVNILVIHHVQIQNPVRITIAKAVDKNAMRIYQNLND